MVALARVALLLGHACGHTTARSRIGDCRRSLPTERADGAYRGGWKPTSDSRPATAHTPTRLQAWTRRTAQTRARRTEALRAVLPHKRISGRRRGAAVVGGDMSSHMDETVAL